MSECVAGNLYDFYFFLFLVVVVSEKIDGSIYFRM